MAGLARVWTALRYTHPWTGYRSDFDVDSSAVTALAALVDARDATDSAQALAGFVMGLRDPATRLLTPPTDRAPANRWPDRARTDGPTATLLPDSTLVVAIHDYAAVSGAGELFDPDRYVASLAGRIGAARAVVLDVRTDETPARDRDDVFLLSDVVTRLLRYVTTRAVTPSAQRHIVWTGFGETEPWGGSPPRAFFQTGQVSVVKPVPGARDIPVVLLANANAELPPYAAALVREGVAALVTEGDVGDAPFAGYRDVDAGGGLRVRVRLSEIIDSAGHGAPPPTAVVAYGDRTDRGDGDPALERALALTRGPLPVRAMPGAPLPTFRVSRPAPGAWTPALATTLPPAGARLFALVKVWGTITTFFPHIDARLGRPWDGVLREFSAPLRDAASVTDYHLALARLMNRLQDSHASVFTPALAAWRQGTAAALPFFLAMVDGRLVVRALNHDSLLGGARVRPGDVVRTIDGEDALVRGRRIAGTLSASTRARADDDAALFVRAGPLGSTAVVVLEDMAGRMHTVRLRRHPVPVLRADRVSRLPPAVRLLTPEIGYVDPSRIHPDSVDHALDRMRNTRALVVEWRDGNAETAFPFVARLLRPDSVLTTSTGVWTNADGRGAPGLVTTESWCRCRHTSRHYPGLAVLLTGPRAQSVVEVNADILRRGNGTLLIGAATGGVATGVGYLVLPGGVRVSPSTGLGPSPTGLVPDVPVEPTRTGLRAGRDEVLDAAVAYFRRRLARSPRRPASTRWRTSNV